MTLGSWNNVVANMMCSHANLANELAERIKNGSDVVTIAYDLQILGAIIDVFDEYEIDYRNGTHTFKGDLTVVGNYIKVLEDNIDITMIGVGTVLASVYGNFTVDHIYFVTDTYYIYPVETISVLHTDTVISFSYVSEMENCLTIVEMTTLGDVANKICQTSWNIDYYLSLNTMGYTP